MKAIYIPSGPKNLQQMFTSIDFRDVEYYFLQVTDQTDAVVATSGKFQLDLCYDVARIHFLNALGTIDALNAKLTGITNDQRSDVWQKPTSLSWEKDAHALQRYNVKSNDTFTVVCGDYGEEDMQWVEELLRSPLAWVEWKGTEGQEDGYIPIVILDSSFPKVKDEDRYYYEVTIKFRLSHETINIRN